MSKTWNIWALGWSSRLAIVDWYGVATAHFRWGVSYSGLTQSMSLNFLTSLGSVVTWIWNLGIVKFFTLKIAPCVHTNMFLNIAKMFKVFQAHLLNIIWWNEFKPLSFLLPFDLSSIWAPRQCCTELSPSFGRVEEATRHLGFIVYRLVGNIKHRCKVLAFERIEMQILVFTAFFTVSKNCLPYWNRIF